MVVCFGGSTGVARERTRFSLVALRRRLSPVLPLSLTSREACDPAVQNLYYLLKRPPPMVSYYFFSWATIFPKEGSRPQGLTAPRPSCGPNASRFHWHKLWRTLCQMPVIQMLLNGADASLFVPTFCPSNGSCRN